MAEKFTTGFVNSLMTTFINDYKNGVLAIYSGTQPTTADEAETGDLLCLITESETAFTAGSAAGGLNFDPTPVAGVASKAAAETWTGTVRADGVAGWFRFYDNSYTTGASTTAKRFDGRIGTGTDAEMQITNTALVKDGEVTISSFPVTLPMAGV